MIKSKTPKISQTKKTTNNKAVQTYKEPKHSKPKRNRNKGRADKFINNEIRKKLKSK